MLKKLSCLVRNVCREEALLCGVLLYVLLTFVPGLLDTSSLWLMCGVRYLMPAALAAWAARAWYDAPAAALSARGLMKSILYSAPAAVFCAVNILVGEFSFHVDVIAAAFAGLSEEFLCRMLLYSAMLLHFQDSGHGGSKAVLLTSLLFGLAHLTNLAGGAGFAETLFQCCYTTLIGLIFANGYRRSGCIWGSVLWHVLLNITGTLFA